MTASTIGENAAAAAEIVKKDVVLKKLFSDNSEEPENYYTFLANPVNALPKMGWIRIRTTHYDDEALIENSTESIRMLCTKVYSGKESFQIQESLSEAHIIFTERGHLAMWGDGKRYLSGDYAAAQANVEMLNPVAKEQSDLLWKSNYNTTFNEHGTYWNKVVIPSNRCIFSKNLKWILYALPGYKYTYVGETSAKGTVLTASETDDNLINDVLEKVSPRLDSSVKIYGDLPNKDSGESAVYVLLYNPVHRKNFRNFYRTLFYGKAQKDGELTSDTTDTVHKHSLNVGGPFPTSFDRVMRKYCNAFIVRNGGDSPSEYYSYADPSCTVVFRGDDTAGAPPKPSIHSSKYSRIGNMHQKNYTRNTWRYKWYALNERAGPVSKEGNDSNFLNLLKKSKDEKFDQLFNTFNSTGAVVCNYSVEETPSLWLQNIAAVSGGSIDSDSYLQSFYNNVKKEKTSQTNINPPDADPSKMTTGIDCGAKSWQYQSCDQNFTTYGDASDIVISGDSQLNQHCNINGLNADNNQNFDGSSKYNIIYPDLPAGSYGEGIGPVLKFDLYFNILTPSTYTSFYTKQKSIAAKMAKAFAVATGLHKKQFSVTPLRGASENSIIFYVDVYMTNDTYTDEGITIDDDHISPMSSDKIVDFFTHLPTNHDVNYTIGFATLVDEEDLSLQSSIQTMRAAPTNNKKRIMYIILIVGILIILVYGYLKYKKII